MKLQQQYLISQSKEAPKKDRGGYTRQRADGGSAVYSGSLAGRPRYSIV
jgi:hypothetical protein